MNTMADLRQECARRLRRALHGQEVDMLDNEVEIPHMLDITPIGAIHTEKVEEGTLLDPEHDFWRAFEEDVNTRGKARRKVESAIRSLQKDDIFRMTYPYGEEADIVYCEVDEMEELSNPMLTTRCADCGESIDVPLSLREENGYYTLGVDVACPHCGFSRALESSLHRR